jgi:hypothetical protein
MDSHWEKEHSKKIIADPGCNKVLSNAPPPSPKNNWGLDLLATVGWSMFNTKYANEKRIFEKQWGTQVLSPHGSFGKNVAKVKKVVCNLPPKQKKRKKTLWKGKGKKFERSKKT